jgi:metal-responsive CopG/Arc/MetJ family transcriptional regulator
MKEKPARKVLLSLQPELADAIDEVAKRQFRSRTDFIREAVRHELEAQGVCPLVAA